MRPTIRICVAAAALVASAAPAQAAELAAGSHEDEFSGLSYRVEYLGAAGETNRVTASYDARTETFTLTDAGVSLIQPKVELLQLGTDHLVKCRYRLNQVTCTGISQANYNALDFEFDLGDGNDAASFTSSRGGTTLTGGTGDDTLTHSGLGAATFDGGAGNDRLTKTGAGAATLDGGDGDDVLNSGPHGSYMYGGPGADAFNGSTGYDLVEFAWGNSNPSPDGHTGVSVTFDGIANDGMPGEGDNVADAVEGVHGTYLADTMTGDERPQSLSGEGGDDVLDGGAGDDDLFGQEGNDRVTGGPGVDWLLGGAGGYSRYSSDGDDVIDARDGGFDRYACDKGTDQVSADPVDAFEYPYTYSEAGDPAECETVETQS